MKLYKITFFLAQKMYRFFQVLESITNNGTWFFLNLREKNCDCIKCKEFKRGVYRK